MLGLTPKKIVTDESYKDMIFKIPIYQRLFEWDEEKIEQLLNDLYSSFSKNADEPYYIGMLTSTRNDNNLVDGQQRFTVMILIAIIMRDHFSEWKKFLLVDDTSSRLYFSARLNDNKYLNNIIKNKKNEEKLINQKMQKGLLCIQEWILEKNKDTEFNIQKFAKFTFEKTTFFISFLPSKYTSKELNKYFESMNSTGRNLESHEIKKIDCLKGLGNKTILSKENATKIWNIVCQMDKLIIRKKKNNAKTETDEELHKKFESAIRELINNNVSTACNYLNEFQADKSENNSLSILDIKQSQQKPQKHNRSSSYHSMLSFSEFLLQILFIQLGGKQSKIAINDFFDVQKLLETFKRYTNKWNENDWFNYFVNLLKYRLILDYYVISIPNDEDGQFDLEFSSDSDEKSKLKQYQAMLYAGSSSKSFYLWLNPYLEHINDGLSKNNSFDCLELLNLLKTEDNKRNLLPSLDALTYQNAPIYWFRRLDYYLWEKNLDMGNKKDLLIDRYRFRRGGRSIEHLYPQNASEQVITWNDKQNIHKFGNLALISSNFNSTQSNDSVIVKFARVKHQIERGVLESIKLYKIYLASNKDDKNWSEQKMLKHEKEMYTMLSDTYK